MSEMRFISDVPNVMKAFRGATAQGIAAATLHLQNKDKQQLSVSGWGKGGETAEHGPAEGLTRRSTDKRKITHKFAKLNKKGKKVWKRLKVDILYGPSLPGESPHLHKGTLRQSVTTNIYRSQLMGRVGVPQTTIYGFYLEVGTKFIKQRPWMVKTFYEELDVLKKLITARFA